MSLDDLYPEFLLALVLWRESRGEDVEGKKAVACSIRNRVHKPSWWGTDWVTVILKPKQYSSFNANDPNAVKFPQQNDNAWQACLVVADQCYQGILTDTTDGATHYYDISIPQPSWAATMENTLNIGKLKFFK